MHECSCPDVPYAASLHGSERQEASRSTPSRLPLLDHPTGLPIIIASGLACAQSVASSRIRWTKMLVSRKSGIEAIARTVLEARLRSVRRSHLPATGRTRHPRGSCRGALDGGEDRSLSRGL